jgi:hypothetical protein
MNIYIYKFFFLCIKSYMCVSTFSCIFLQCLFVHPFRPIRCDKIMHIYIHIYIQDLPILIHNSILHCKSKHIYKISISINLFIYKHLQYLFVHSFSPIWCDKIMHTHSYIYIYTRSPHPKPLNLISYCKSKHIYKNCIYIYKYVHK